MRSWLTACICGRTIRAFLLLVCLLAIQFLYLRYWMRADLFIYSYFDRFRPGLLESRTLVELFMPLPDFSGAMQTTGQILFHFLAKVVTPAGAWYISNAVLLIAIFLGGLYFFRSFLVAGLAAFGIIFSSIFYHTYQLPGTIAYPAIVAYQIAHASFTYRLVMAQRFTPGGVCAFILLSLVVAMANENWLNYFIAFSAVFALSFALYRRSAQAKLIARFSILFGLFSLVFLAYLTFKLALSSSQITHSGAELDLALTYPYLLLALEDMVANYFHLLFSILTSYGPVLIKASPSLLLYGPLTIQKLQFGYHSEFSYLAFANHYFTWRFFAGGLCLGFIVLSANLFLRLRQDRGNAFLFATVALCLCVLATSPLLLLYKFRPYNSLPYVHYQLGMNAAAFTFLLALSLARWINRTRRSILWICLLCFFLANALVSPYYHLAMSHRLGIDYNAEANSVYLKNIEVLLHCFSSEMVTTRRP